MRYLAVLCVAMRKKTVRYMLKRSCTQHAIANATENANANAATHVPRTYTHERLNRSIRPSGGRSSSRIAYGHMITMAGPDVRYPARSSAGWLVRSLMRKVNTSVGMGEIHGDLVLSPQSTNFRLERVSSSPRCYGCGNDPLPSSVKVPSRSFQVLRQG